jgi:mono/diheme cytochrome c family protein
MHSRVDSRFFRRTVTALLIGLLAGCSPPEDPSPDELSYHRDIKEILDARCVNCHQAGEIAPFALDSYEDARDLSSIVADSVGQGTMPPWMPDNTCSEYQNDRSLSDSERDDLLRWVDAGTPEGNPADSEGNGASDPPGETEYDVSLTMTEPYTPQLRPDDYRCFILDWEESEEKFVTGFRARPGSAEMVHHVIAFVINPSGVSTFRAMDEADDGVGYTCFGSPAVGPSSVASASSWRWLGSWAPGGSHRAMPEGTGVRIQPGSVVVMQVHYNTIEEEPHSDVTSFEVQLSEQVDKPAIVLPVTRYGWISGSTPMHIPAGSPDTVHSTRIDLSEDILGYLGSEAGLSSGDAFRIHSIGLHMHLLGTRGRIWLDRSGGSEQCLLDIPRWDFNWQGTYDLVEPVTVQPGDHFNLECEWDNTAENQIVVDGEQLPPQDIEWGDGTRDEMCLAIAYITAI